MSSQHSGSEAPASLTSVTLVQVHPRGQQKTQHRKVFHAIWLPEPPHSEPPPLPARR